MILQNILNKIDHLEFVGDLSVPITQVVSLDDVNNYDNALSWCSDKNENFLSKINSSSVIILSKNVTKFYNLKNYLIVENPRRTFQEILTQFFSPKRLPKISETSQIEKNVVIGKDVFIGHNVVIEDNCRIGNFCSILHNTIILKDTTIGNNVTIGSNNTIGGVGFGYEKNVIGDFELIPHIGNVLIGDNVDIGNNTCIDRAVLGSTVLGDNVKIDNLVHIAHGVKIGRNSVVIANAMVAGSVNIGEDSWIAPSASIINKKNIGHNALVGLGAVVTKDVEDYAVVAGNPAKFLKSLN